jgi:uncharacterized repeat protein (TIGR01451 family)
MRSLLAAVFAGVVLAGGVGVTPAAAESPWWRVALSARPAVLAPGGEGTIVVQAVNAGDSPTSGAVTLTDTLPAGVTAQSVAFYASRFSDFDLTQFGLVSCETLPGSVRCEYPEVLPGANSYEELEMRVGVKVAANTASGVESRMEVSGGGGAFARSLARPLTLGAGGTPFGVDAVELVPEEEGGAVDARAGSHPFQLSGAISFNQTADTAKPPALVRDARLKLPAGLVGNTKVIPQCSEQDFAFEAGAANLCPDDTVLGVAVVTFDEPAALRLKSAVVPLFNLVPSRGEPARFGFEALHGAVIFDTAVRNGSDYGVTASVSNITQLVNPVSAQVTFWGVPGDPRHDSSRGWNCVAGGAAGVGPCVLQGQTSPVPLLTLPTSCALPFVTSVEGRAWPTRSNPEGLALVPGEYSLRDDLGREIGLTGCDQLPFTPSIHVTADTNAASTPTGLTASVHIPQDASSNPTGLSEAALKDTTVVLPEGVQINPSSADGLEACSMGQVGYEGMEAGVAQFTSDPATCPDASKVGTVDEVKTPLLSEPLTGSIYLAAQGANPFGSLLALYIVADDPVSGVRAKLAGNVSLDPVTGRLTAVFNGAPQTPVEDIKLHFFGGSRAPLATPALCGSYTTAASFTSWSSTTPVESSSSFPITSGLAGGPCQGGLGFSPSLTAGSTNIQAGAFTPFTTTLGRQDNEQVLSGVQLHLPPGLLGDLASATQCPEPQAALGTCGPDSLIGHTTVSAGLGTDPFTVPTGQVFITGPYHGAPFGLSIAVPAKAGPFDIGSGPCDCVVVRAKVQVDPHTAQITVDTDPLPTILQGIPLQVKHVNVTVDRPGFMFNPTSCNPMSATGTLTGGSGGISTASVPFQVTNCGSLPFKPTFKVSTQANTSKKNGASLDVKVTSGQGQVNLGKVAVTLPKALPSRLTTIQQACPQATFNANPASCPAGSNIGTAIAHTPVLSSAVTGPAYLVSHGGAAFPDLVLILQGEGVTLELVGSIDIKKGITSSTFARVPDAPISSFELKLPEGPHSGLAAVLPPKAKGSLCGTSLVMPTTLTGQNGAVLKQNTKIAVTGCAKATRRAHGKKTKAKAHKKSKHGKKGK